MRKDVKLGLAVGGILFAVVLAYVVFFAGKNAKNKQQASAPGPAPTDVSPQPGGSGDIVPGPRTPGPTPAPDGVGGGTNPTPAPGTGGVSFGPGTITPAPDGTGLTPGTTTPGPTTPGTTPPDTTTAWTWGTGLDTGAAPPPLLSRTPTPTPGTGGSELTPGGLVADSTNPTTRPAGTRTYIVKPGETYWTIAKAEYGNGSYWSHISRANPKIPPSKLRAGIPIMLPDKAAVVPPTVANRESTPTRPFDPATQYRVKPGDSLHTICKNLYGKTDLVAKLYELNKETIGPNPGALKLNMVLTLPQPVTPAPTPGLPPVTPAATGSGVAGALN